MIYLQIDFISTLTWVERGQINASFYAMVDDQWSCSKCLNQKRPEHMIEKLRKVKGCWDISEKPRYTVDDIEFYKCVGNYYLVQFPYIWSMFMAYKKGVMPYPGSMASQPAKLVEIFNILYNLEAEHKRTQMEKQRQKNSQGRK